MGLRFDIAFEGGGARGLVLNGAMSAFHRRGYVPRRVVGTSAGGMAATCVAAGYDGDELVALSREKTPSGAPIFASFLERGPEHAQPYRGDRRAVARVPGLGRAVDFVEHGGFFTGGGFVAWLESTLERKGAGYSRATLAELHEATGAHLTVVASDTVGKRMLVLNHLTAPKCPVVWAARMSMSIPFFFEEVTWRSSWGRYMGEDITGAIVVDGGILSNFPLRLVLPRALPRGIELMGPPPSDEANVLGLSIDVSIPVPDAPPAPDSAGEEVFGWLGKTKMGRRIERVASTTLDGNDVTVEVRHEAEICRLPAKDYETTEFFMTDARIEALLAAGRAAAERYFETRFGARHEAAALRAATPSPGSAE